MDCDITKKLVDGIVSHYALCWNNQPNIKHWDKGPVSEMSSSFCVLEFSPTRARAMWTYATCAMSLPLDAESIELHLFSPVQSELHVELLTAIAHYHRTGNRLGLGHTVNLGRPWLPGSKCSYGYISLPYLDGPTLENCKICQTNQAIQCLWLIPITKEEREYKREHGIEMLERQFEITRFQYVDPLRQSVV